MHFLKQNEEKITTRFEQICNESSGSATDHPRSRQTPTAERVCDSGAPIYFCFTHKSIHCYIWCIQIKSTPDLASLFESIQKDSGDASSNGMDLSWGGGRRGAGRGLFFLIFIFMYKVTIMIYLYSYFSGEASGSVCGMGGVKRKRADSGHLMEVDHIHHPGPQRPSKKWWPKILWFCYSKHLAGVMIPWLSCNSTCCGFPCNFILVCGPKRFISDLRMIGTTLVTLQKM